MDYKKLAGNLSVAFLAQGIAMCISIATSLFVPKILGVEQFGYWQLFLLYASYAGFFHLGVNDGVYLLNGGTPRENLDKQSAVSQFIVSTAFQFLIAVAIIAFSFVVDGGAEREFVVIAVALYIPVYNAACYLGFLFQAIGETKLYSFSVMIDRLVFLCPLVVLILLGVSDFEPYAVAFFVSKVISLIFCMWKAQDILHAKKLNMQRAIHETFESMRVGISLMIANVASILILGSMRMIVDFAWGIEAFSEISFSLTLVSFILVFINQASMVLFPTLREVDNEERKKFFTTARNLLSLFLPITYLLFVPFKIVLLFWLPEYASSLDYFALLIPICVFDGRMNLISITYFKVFRWEKCLLAINLAFMFLACVSTALGVYVFESANCVLLFVVLIITARSVMSELLLAKRIGEKQGTLWVWEILLSVIFVFCTAAFSYIVSTIIFAVAYAIFIFVNRDKFCEISKMRKSVG